MRCTRLRMPAATRILQMLRDSYAVCYAGTGGTGVHSRCQLLFRIRWLLPNRVHGLVQDEW